MQAIVLPLDTTLSYSVWMPLFNTELKTNVSHTGQIVLALVSRFHAKTVDFWSLRSLVMRKNEKKMYHCVIWAQAGCKDAIMGYLQGRAEHQYSHTRKE